MKSIVHKSDTRGGADHGWLKAKHTFSFAHYYDPSRIHFGALRVLNDDLIAPMMGFGTHPHDNMEIVSIILNGTIRHKDSMGNVAEIQKNEVQIMSAGTGIQHSEFNGSKTETLNLLQIWVMPKEHNIKPRYDQITLNEEDRENKIQAIITPDKTKPMWINQDAWFSRVKLSAGKNISYNINKEGNGVYVFAIEGSGTIAGLDFKKRDGVGVWETESLNVEAKAESEILFIEVPMKF